MQELSKKQTKKALRDSITNGAFSSGMSGITDTYTTPFALALGATDVQIGLLNSIPKFFSVLTQPIAGKIIEWSGKRKKICNTLLLISRLIWIPILLIPFIFLTQQVLWLIVLLTLSQIVASIATTSWISWIADIVPIKIRGDYFGKRNMVAGIASFLTTLIGGWILGFIADFIGFVMIFSLALILGLLSIYFLEKIPEPDFKPHKKHILRFPKFDIIKHKNFFNFTIHRALINFSVWIAAPFFIVYMLNVLKIGYIWYAIVVGIEAIIAIISGRYWGKLADRFGDKRILLACNILIIFYPFFWLFVFTPSDIWLIILAAILSGFGWAGFDLTNFNYLLDSTPSGKRPTYVANYNLLTGLALFAGPLVGGYLAESFTDMSLFWIRGLQLLFLVSFILRIVSTMMFLRFRETRVKTRVPVKDVFLRVVAIYPMRGIVHEVIYMYHYLYRLERKALKRFKKKSK